MGDKVFTVFNIGGNNYRLVAGINYRTQRIFIKHVQLMQSMTGENGKDERGPQWPVRGIGLPEYAAHGDHATAARPFL